MNLSIVSFFKTRPQGTYDREGSPLVLFTGSKHDTKHSDMKTAIQLLFYTLNQAAERLAYH